MKTQTVRLLDVFLIGPLMVWGGAQAARHNPAAGLTLLLFGAATVSYNGVNYLEQRRR